MEKLREEDRKAGLKEGMKITQLLIIKRKANGAEHFTCSTKILAWSAQPSKRTWLATSSTFHRMIFWRSLDTAAWLLWFMEVLSSLRKADGNPLPSGHGNEKGETCWMPLNSLCTRPVRLVYFDLVCIINCFRVVNLSLASLVCLFKSLQ